MSLKSIIFRKCATFFYRIAEGFIVAVNKNLKTNLDEFWTSLDHFFEGEHEEAPFEPESKEMIEGIYDLKETKVREVMVPRTELAAVRVSDSIEKVANVIQKAGRSRIPVFEDKIDNIVGILYAKDVLKEVVANQGKLTSIEKIMRPAYFVPETKNISDLLQELKAKKVHLAIVIDEYGGISGLVTMEDLIEEIIGEVQDEYDNEKERIIPLDENTWEVNAKTTIDDINESLELEIPQNEDYDTLAGFILAKLGRIPEYKEKLEADDLTFVIMESSEKSIEKVKIIKHDKTEEKENNDHD
ncbi:hemolysin family protein [Candidatus Omnitrophota bacterium]